MTLIARPDTATPEAARRIEPTFERRQLFAGLQSIVLMRRLEERIMFDGAALMTADAAIDGDVPDAADSEPAQADDAGPEATFDPTPALDGAPGPVALIPDPKASVIVFIDPAVRDAGAIVAAAGEDAEFVLLDQNQGGLEQIAAYLKGREGLSAIHIVSHGEAGELHLGSDRTDADGLRDAAGDLRAIGAALGADGDILIYGCNVAKGEAGAAFVQLLADLTDADVAASTDDTGGSDLGGDFDLESRIGMIEASPLTPPEFQGILAPLSISASGLPTVTGGTSTGATAIWHNAGFIGGTAIDVRATVTAADVGADIQFSTSGDDLWLKVTSGDATVRWEIFQAGTNQTVGAVGDPSFSIRDLDGDDSIVATPPTLEVEAVAPNLNGLSSFTTETPTNLVSHVGGGTLTVLGTANQFAEPNSMVTFNWSKVSSWDVTYSAQIGWGQRFFFHDGDGDFTFAAPNTTYMLGLDLDANNSTAGGTGYHASFTENGAAVAVVDADVVITQHSALGTDLHSATVTLTNAKASDQLLVAGSSAASGIVSGLAYSIASSGGQITVALSGTASLATYEAALKAITFNNTSETPDTANRVIEVAVTNATFGTTSNIALSTIEVDAQNDPVTAGSLADQASSDGSSISVATAPAFADADGDALTYSASGLPAGLSIHPSTGVISGSLTALASQGGSGGAHTVTVTASDGHGSSAQSTFTFTVSNPAPDARNDALGVSENGPAITGSVLTDHGSGADRDGGNDSDPLTVVSALNSSGGAIALGAPVTLPSGAILTLNANGTYSYDPNGVYEALDSGETATETFTYTIADGQGGTDTATVTITISGANDAPTAGAIANLTRADGDTISIPAGAAFSDVDGETLSYSASGLPAWLAIDPATGAISGTAPADASQGGLAGSGLYSITVTASDGTTSSSASFALNVGNPAPIAAADVNATHENASQIGGNVLGNDHDGGADHDVLTVTGGFNASGAVIPLGAQVALPSGALLTLNAGGTYTYKPNGAFESLDLDESAIDTFSYTIADGEGGTATATVTITIDGRNDAPQAGTLPARSALDGAAVNLDLGALFSDPDIEPLAFTISGLPQGLSYNPATGLITGTIDPDASQHGLFPAPGGGSVYTIQVAASDGDAEITRSFNFTVQNPAPVAEDDALAAAENGPIVTGNALTGNGTGADHDGGSDSDAIAVTAVNGAAGLLGAAVAGTNGGSFNVGGDGAVTFDPAGGFEDLAAGETRTTTVTYTISDGQGGTDTATITVTVAGSNDGPDAVNDSGSVAESGITGGDLIANDTDPDTSDVLAVAAINGNPALVGVSVPGSAGGVFTVAPNGTYSFDPAGDFEGLAAGETRATVITYTIADGHGGVDTATVTITVTGENDTPIVIDPATGLPAADPNASVPAQHVTDGAAITPLALTPFFVDPDTSDTLTLSLDLADLPPGLTFDPMTGEISGVVDPSASQGGPNGDGTYPITVTATDPHGATVTTIVLYRVVNPAPVAEDDALGASEDVAIAGQVLADNGAGADHDTAPDADLLQVAAINGDPALVGMPVAGSNGGSFTIESNGSLVFDPAGDFEDLAQGEARTTTLAYTISDGEGGSDIATVTVTVAGVNDAPIVIDPMTGNPPADPQAIVPEQAASDGEAPIVLDLAPFFADPDTSDMLELSVDPATLPPGLSFDPMTGTIAGTLAAGASQGGPDGDGVYAIAVTATDPHGSSVTTTVVYRITNLAPVAQDDAVAAGEDAPIVLDVLADNGAGPDHDTAPDSDTLSVTAVDGEPAGVGTPVAGSNGGLFTIAAGGLAGFDPNGEFEDLAEGETRITTISYLVSDGNGGTDLATITVTVTGANDAPVVVDPTTGEPPADPQAIVPVQIAVDGAAMASLPLAPFFADPDASDTLTLSLDAAELPPGLTFDPATATISGTLGFGASQGGPNGDGVYPVTVTATDPHGASVTTIVLYRIANPAPVAVDDALDASEDVSTGGNVLADNSAGADHDTAPDSDPLHVAAVNGEPALVGTAVPGSSGGSFAIASDGSVAFDPAGDFEDLAEGETRTTTIAYTVSDGQGGTDVATVTVTVTGVNDAPDAIDDGGSTAENSVLEVAAANGLLANDRDVDASDELIVAAINGDPALVGVPVTGSAGGQLTVNPDGSYRFDPGSDFEDLADGEIRATAINYQVADGHGGFDVATLTITVTGTNDGPVVVDPANPGDPNPDPTSVVAMQSGRDGEAINPLDLSVFFEDPDASDTLEFTASGLPPGLGISLAAGVVSGTLDPAASVGGPYLVTVTATDPHGATTSVSFLWSVANPAPVAEDDSVSASEDTLSLAANVMDDNGSGLDRDGAPDGDTLHVAAVNGDHLLVGMPVAGSSGGSFTIAGDGSLVFVPGGDFQDLAVGESRATTVSYLLSDGQGGSDLATVTVVMTGVNDGPRVLDPATGLPAGEPNAIVPVQPASDGGPVATLDLTPYFGDPDTSDTLTLSLDPASLPPGLVFDPATGTIAGTADPSASTGGPNGDGVYVIIVTATDPHGATVTTLVVYQVANLAPIAQDDALQSGEDAGFTGNVLADNGSGADADAAPDSDPLAVAAVNGNPALVGVPVAGSAGGSFTIAPDGSVSFDPDGDFQDLALGETRTTNITYTVSDGQGGTDTATLTVTVRGANDGPVADPAHLIAAQRGIDAGTISPLDVSAAFADPDDSDTLSYAATGLPPGLSIDPATGIISGTIAPDASSHGRYVVTVTASDPHGASTSLTFSWAVRNPGPVAVDDTAQSADGASAHGSVAGNDHDPDGDDLSFAVVKGPKLGTLTLNPDGSYVYTPRLGAQGVERIVYEVRDADGGVSTAVLVIRVVPGENPINVSSFEGPAPSVPASTLLGILADRQPDDHGAIEVTWPNNLFIHFVVTGDDFRLETQYGLGAGGEIGRYLLASAVDTSDDNGGGIIDPLAASLLDDADGWITDAGEDDDDEDDERQGSLVAPPAPGFTAALERSREAFDRRALDWLRDLAKVA